MPEALERLIDSLLYEGYALYPYTPGATKNATPTPFGILYPPGYAAELASTFERLELRCVLEAPPGALLSAEVRFLASSGERHEAVAHRVQLQETTLAALARASAAAEAGAEREAEIAGGSPGRLLIGLSLTALEIGEDTYEMALSVENRTPCAPGLDRPAALAHSLLSTHPVLRSSDGRFSSPLERPCQSVNTYPVLASEADDAVLGAAIVLPDHPQIAPESRGDLFDSTEIEEALLLHLRVLTDSERAQIEDPVVREMMARADAATPDEILALHGRVTVRDPVGAGVRSRVSETPPEEPAHLVDPQAGEQEADVDGVRFRRGGKVRISPGPDADLHARMLDGRIATIERIMIDYDGKVHLGVTVDDDPGQELLRETGRLLYFFPPMALSAAEM